MRQLLAKLAWAATQTGICATVGLELAIGDGPYLPAAILLALAGCGAALCVWLSRQTRELHRAALLDAYATGRAAEASESRAATDDDVEDAAA